MSVRLADACKASPGLQREVPWLDRLVAWLILLVGLYSVASSFRSFQYLLVNLADDAAYYLRIAENVVAGHGFTFDGMDPTNGFHPLWQWVLIALYRAAPLPPESMVRLVWGLQSVLLTIATWLLWRLMRRTAGSWPAALAAVLFVGRLYYTGRSGMESALLLFLLALVLDHAERTRPFGGGGGRVRSGARTWPWARGAVTP